MKMEPEMRRSRTIPSLIEFSQLTPERQERAYAAAYLALIDDGYPTVEKDKAKRRALLKAYQKEASWSDEQVKQLQERVQAELSTHAVES